MDVPEEFKRLTQCFWQGSEQEAKDEDDWIARSLRLCGEREQAIVKAFLADLLARDPSVAELKKIWQSGGPSYGITTNMPSNFLRRFAIWLKVESATIE